MRLMWHSRQRTSAKDSQMSEVCVVEREEEWCQYNFLGASTLQMTVSDTVVCHILWMVDQCIDFDAKCISQRANVLVKRLLCLLVIYYFIH